jgi:hypothetical protein
VTLVGAASTDQAPVDNHGFLTLGSDATVCGGASQRGARPTSLLFPFADTRWPAAAG